MFILTAPYPSVMSWSMGLDLKFGPGFYEK